MRGLWSLGPRASRSKLNRKCKSIICRPVSESRVRLESRVSSLESEFRVRNPSLRLTGTGAVADQRQGQ